MVWPTHIETARVGTAFVHLVLPDNNRAGLLELLDWPERCFLLFEDGKAWYVLHSDVVDVALDFDIILDSHRDAVQDA